MGRLSSEGRAGPGIVLTQTACTIALHGDPLLPVPAEALSPRLGGQEALVSRGTQSCVVSDWEGALPQRYAANAH